MQSQDKTAVFLLKQFCRHSRRCIQKENVGINTIRCALCAEGADPHGCNIGCRYLLKGEGIHDKVLQCKNRTRPSEYLTTTVLLCFNRLFHQDYSARSTTKARLVVPMLYCITSVSSYISSSTVGQPVLLLLVRALAVFGAIENK